ncbi:MAG: SurA N-terminal domain-containing protein [Pseudomonadota bacterium]
METAPKHSWTDPSPDIETTSSRQARAAGSRRRGNWILAMGSAVALIASTAIEAQRGVVEIDRVVAIVNDDVIVRSELETQSRVVQAQIQSREGQAPSINDIAGEVLERLIVERLQLQVAERLGISVNDDELNQAVASIARRNDLALTEFRDALETDGYPFNEFRENIRKEMMIARVRRRQGSPWPITLADILSSDHDRHIFRC